MNLILITGIVSMACTLRHDHKNTLQIDHVILAIYDLESGIRQFEEKTGLKLVYSGIHPNSDTQNAIVPLEGGMYVEILAPKNSLGMVEYFQGFRELKPIGFAISTPDIHELERAMDSLQFDTNGSQSGERTTEKGENLKWKLLMIKKPDLNINPFFISWPDDARHPSSNQHPKCNLEGLKLNTLYKAEINQILKKFDSKIENLTISEGEQSLAIVINTPKGKIAF